MERVEIQVRGRVQGVAFRWYTQRKAVSLGLTGWVRNLPDGSVRILAEGPRQELETFRDWALRGPDRAFVTDHEVNWSGSTGDYEDFRITG